MTHRVLEEDEWEEDDGDEEAWAADDDDDESIKSCPYCHRQVHEQAIRCPYCENYLSKEDAPATRKPWWMILGALLCLYALYRWIVP